MAVYSVTNLQNRSNLAVDPFLRIFCFKASFVSGDQTCPPKGWSRDIFNWMKNSIHVWKRTECYPTLLMVYLPQRSVSFYNYIHHCYKVVMEGHQIHQPCRTTQVSMCNEDIRAWMLANRLELNDDKTEYLQFLPSTKAKSYQQCLLPLELRALTRACQPKTWVYCLAQLSHSPLT